MARPDFPQPCREIETAEIPDFFELLVVLQVGDVERRCVVYLGT